MTFQGASFGTKGRRPPIETLDGPFAAKPRTSCWWVRGIQWTLRLTKLHKHARSDQRTASKGGPLQLPVFTCKGPQNPLDLVGKIYISWLKHRNLTQYKKTELIAVLTASDLLRHLVVIKNAPLHLKVCMHKSVQWKNAVFRSFKQILRYLHVCLHGANHTTIK